MDSENNPKRRRRKKTEDNPLDAHLRKLAREGAGKPLSESLSEGSPLKDLIGRFVEIALEEEMRDHLGYERHDRLEGKDTPTERRENTRNGRTKKKLKTSHGETEIDVPRDRQGTFDPAIVPKYGTVTKDVEDRVVGMYAAGMTTRDIQAQVQELYGIEASEMFVSRIVEKLDPELSAWRNRPLESLYPVVYVDALHQKVRHASGVTATAVYVVSAYGESGTMEILGVYIAPEGYSTAESASFWHQVFATLEKRGLADILILCADQLTGLERAVSSVYPQARFQPCVVHVMRSTLRRVPWSERKKVAREVKKIYQAPSFDQAEVALQALHDRYASRYPGLVRGWEQVLPRLSDLWHYSVPLRKLVYTINPIENVNRQVRKVTKNRGVMPNPDSALRLMTLVLQRIDRKAQKQARHDWPRIVDELAIHFPDRVPDNWGFRI
ncbi:MAG: IS256 family transposase [Rhodothermales bacterium]|nr:IS256 family transposase [Rhodothermales bacterium]MBO6781652.1 IS256 family transposase [Rhodothermales bacterium]